MFEPLLSQEAPSASGFASAAFSGADDEASLGVIPGEDVFEFWVEEFESCDFCFSISFVFESIFNWAKFDPFLLALFVSSLERGLFLFLEFIFFDLDEFLGAYAADFGND